MAHLRTELKDTCLAACLVSNTFGVRPDPTKASGPELDRCVAESKRLADELMAEFRQATAVDGLVEVLFDLDNVVFFSGAMLGHLLALNKLLKLRACTLKIRNIAPHIYALFTETRLDKALDVQEKPRQAA
jgi:anti-anti-sigma regulatory factor